MNTGSNIALDQKRLTLSLRVTRFGKGLTLREVARQTGISASTLSRIENGKCPNIELKTFLALCNWLDMHPAKFFTKLNEEAYEYRF